MSQVGEIVEYLVPGMLPKLGQPEDEPRMRRAVTHSAAPSPFPRLRGLDGIRALAVAAVVAFHLGWDLVPGGFLGVEVFFVVSGYLITALLLHEWQETGRISLPRFWMRRARRLLPALFVVLLGTLAIAAVAFPQELARLRPDALAATGYVTNWYLIAAEQPYFETVGRPSALLHLWSLAIEEQFYLLWPLALLAALAIRGRAGAAILALTGIAASVVLTLVLFTPGGDPSRVYYGTDTRAAGLLIGAALALGFMPVTAPLGRLGQSFRRVFAQARTAEAHRRRVIAHDLAAAAGLVTLVAAFAVVAETDMAFPGGLLVVDLATAVLIATVVGPAARLVPAILETAPLRWLGTRSYAVYLWHWPVIVFSRPVVDVPLEGPANLAVRLVAIGLLSELSYRFVERPIREGALGRLVRELGTRRTRPAWGLASVRGATAATTVLAIVVLLGNVALASPPPPPAEVPVANVNGLVTPEPDDDAPEPTRMVAPTPDPTPPPTTPQPDPSQGATPVPEVSYAPTPPPSQPAPTPQPDPTPPPETSRPPAPPVGGRITAFGESVFIAAAPRVARAVGPMQVDAAIGRQMDEHVDVIRAWAGKGRLGDAVILGIGNNGPILSRHVEALMPLLRDVPKVVWINVSLAREWTDHNNRAIASIARRYPNVRVADWHAASWGHRELFATDMVHPNKRGADVFAALVRDALVAP